MALIDYPMHIIPNSASIRMISNTKTYKSTFNGSSKTARFNGTTWALTLGYNNLDWEIPALSAFMFSLDGSSGRVMLPPFHKMGAPARGNPKIGQANQSGRILQTKDWLPNQVVLKVGDFFSVNDELKIITKDVVSDDNGLAVLEFAPWLRESPDLDAEIVTEIPTGRFKLEEDSVGLDIDPESGSVSLTFVEAFYI